MADLARTQVSQEASTSPAMNGKLPPEPCPTGNGMPILSLHPRRDRGASRELSATRNNGRGCAPVYVAGFLRRPYFPEISIMEKTTGANAAIRISAPKIYG